MLTVKAYAYKQYLFHTLLPQCLMCNIMKISQMDQRTLYLMVILFFCAVYHNNYDINPASETIFLQSVDFSDQSCQTVPDNTVSYFFTYGYS